MSIKGIPTNCSHFTGTKKHRSKRKKRTREKHIHKNKYSGSKKQVQYNGLCEEFLKVR